MFCFVVFMIKKTLTSIMTVAPNESNNLFWKEIKTVEEAEQFINDNEFVVMGFFRNIESDAAIAFFSVAIFLSGVKFGVTSNEIIFKTYEANSDAIMLFKKTDEIKTILQNEANVQNIQTFIHVYSLPLINDFNQESSQRIFNGIIKSHLLLFVSKTSDDNSLIEPLKPVAAKFRGKITFVVFNLNEDHDVVYNFFGITTKVEATYRLMHLNDDISKYKPESNDFSPESIASFISKFLNGRLKQDLLSQDLPEDWDKNPVKILVANKFDEIAMDPTKNVLVVFYAPWCGPCKQMDPVINELAERYKNDESIVIAKIDATLNDLEHTKIRIFPTIKLYRKGDNEVVDYTMSRTLPEFIKFLNSIDKTDKDNISEDTSTDEEMDYNEEGHIKDKITLSDKNTDETNKRGP